MVMHPAKNNHKSNSHNRNLPDPTSTESTSLLLERFVAKARRPLGSITSLHLNLSAREWEPADGLLLMQACPALTSLTISGMSLSPALLSDLGRLCPRLSNLTIENGKQELPELDGLLLALPNLFTRLTLNLKNQYIPDMSRYPGIVALELPSFDLGDTCGDYDNPRPPFVKQWLSLPPKLQHLRCEDIFFGPDAFNNGRPTLVNLLSVEVAHYIELPACVKLLQAAPVLKSITQDPNVWKRKPISSSSIKGSGLFTINIMSHQFTLSSAADLACIQQRLETGLVMAVTLRFCYYIEHPTDDQYNLLQTFIKALPRMNHVTSCIFEEVPPALLRPLLCAFPNMTDIGFHHAFGMDDISLQYLAICPCLNTIRFSSSEGVSPFGLQNLCQRLPDLKHVSYWNCDLLNEQSMQECVAMLKAQGSQVKMFQADVWIYGWICTALFRHAWAQNTTLNKSTTQTPLVQPCKVIHKHQNILCTCILPISYKACL